MKFQGKLSPILHFTNWAVPLLQNSFLLPGGGQVDLEACKDSLRRHDLIFFFFTLLEDLFCVTVEPVRCWRWQIVIPFLQPKSKQWDFGCWCFNFSLAVCSGNPALRPGCYIWLFCIWVFCSSTSRGFISLLPFKTSFIRADFCDWRCFLYHLNLSSICVRALFLRFALGYAKYVLLVERKLQRCW